MEGCRDQEPFDSTLIAGNNKGKLPVDATCTPADISYPIDLRLINDGRSKLEEIIEALHEPQKGEQKSPLTNLSRRMYEPLLVIVELYRQQKEMYYQRSQK
jgi:hypothetical protein